MCMHQEMYVKALVLYLLTRITCFGSHIILPIEGNVYPLGHYTVSIDIGNSENYYVLDVDTGSDLTWVSSSGDNPYISNGKNMISCNNSACTSLGDLRMNGEICDTSDLPCEYKVEYGDGTSYTGSLVRDSFHLMVTNISYSTTMVAPNLTFGCGDSKNEEHSFHQPITDGVLGLGKGESGILKQMYNMSLIRNVVSYCLFRRGGGFLFFGELTDLNGITWKRLSSKEEHYSLGKANILLRGETTDIKNLSIIFDSGSTYTYFESEAYEALLDLVNKTIDERLIVADDDNTLPVCWKDVVGPIITFANVTNYFLPVALNFTDDANHVRFEIPPESYLIISDKHNVCLGILNGGEIGLEDVNLIGDISMQDKLVIYDNENDRVGWGDNC
ncbi:hypothetical protein CASFOL_016740 [Castilleja foliolosa]|uniref:Peptidase A1 domain-containing protein n=1 Tax=Castilleja foliolosa TaxID=1961234 RepID=A0ABD3D933_9LAMI